MKDEIAGMQHPLEDDDHMKIIRAIIATSILLSPFAHATSTYIRIPDASQLKYLMESSGIVYFRNLNDFDNTVTGCCYAFSLDKTTAYGKSAWGHAHTHRLDTHELTGEV